MLRKQVKIRLLHEIYNKPILKSLFVKVFKKNNFSDEGMYYGTLTE
jgi:hypothetical protein